MTDVADWWRTSIIDMEPGRIAIRGEPIEGLIGNLSFPGMIWLMLRGNTPDRGPGAAAGGGAGRGGGSWAAGAVDCHGADGGDLWRVAERGDGVRRSTCWTMYMAARASRRWSCTTGSTPAAMWRVEMARWKAERGKYVPGFGHRFHKPVDPRAPRLMALVREAAADGVCDGRFAGIAEAIEAELTRVAGKPVPMNIDGATAVIYAELGFAAPLARGLFCLSRSVGILAHAWEQMQQGGRNKGPTPPGYRWTYEGPAK